MRSFVVLLTLFALALCASAWLYPGGTWFDRSSPGFSFWGNFWCDLLHQHAFNRSPNTSSMWLARVSFWLFGAALVRFWPLAATLSPRPKVQRWVSALGLSGAAALFFVTVFSSLSEPLLHGVFVVASALLGVFAASVLSLALYRSVDPLTRVISLGLIASALLSVGQYMRQGMGGDAALWLAGAQKITTIFLLLFMLRCALLYKRTQLARA